MSASESKLAPGKIVFVVRSKRYGYFRWRTDDEFAWCTLEEATTWPYEERTFAENTAKNVGCVVEAWVSRDSTLTMQIPLEAVC